MTFWSASWIALCAFALHAQSQTGELRIEVRDTSGAAMQAAGKLENSTDKTARNFVTDAQGVYTFQGLPLWPVSRRNLPNRLQRSGGDDRCAIFDSRLAGRHHGTGDSREANSRCRGPLTPLAGTELSVDQVAASVQTATAADVENSGALDIGDFMNRRLNGISINEMQGNPFQPDINFRGYTASPLLGTPEGVSVYLDGVRQNQPFGDVVSWDLIPKNAISEVELMPGSDPLFGLNTLGGALSVQTKNGVTDPGFDGTFTYGSSNRKQGQANYGWGKATGFNVFLAGNYFHESGWRVDSPSTVRQTYGRLGWRSDKTDVAVTFSYADNELIGNGLQDYRLLAANYSSVYSIPDSTINRAPSINLIVRHTFSNALSFSGNGWYRHINTGGINANLNTDSFDESVYQPNAKEIATLTAAGYTGVPASGATAANTPFPKYRCIAEALIDADVDDRCDGIDIYSTEIQNDFGFSNPDDLAHFALDRAESVHCRGGHRPRQRGLCPEHPIRLSQPELHHQRGSGIPGRVR